MASDGEGRFMKRTHKKRSIGIDRIRTALRTSRSLNEAARTLSVNRRTLHRWLEADPSLKEPRTRRLDVVQHISDAARALSPDEWMHAIEAVYELDDTERILVDLARQALIMACDNDARSTERLQAMNQFQRLIKQLDFEVPDGKTQAPHLYSVK